MYRCPKILCEDRIARGWQTLTFSCALMAGDAEGGASAAFCPSGREAPSPGVPDSGRAVRRRDVSGLFVRGCVVAIGLCLRYQC